MALRPDVEDAVVRHGAAEAYLKHAPAHFAIDLLNGVVAHLERACREVRALGPTETRMLLDGFLRNVIEDIRVGAERDMSDEQAMVRAMMENPKQKLPPLGPSKRPAGYMPPDYWRRAYDRDYPAGNEVEG